MTISPEHWMINAGIVGAIVVPSYFHISSKHERISFGFTVGLAIIGLMVGFFVGILVVAAFGAFGTPMR